MEFKEYARKRFEKENEGNGLSMDKDYSDGLKDRIMLRLDIIIHEGFCIELMKYAKLMKHIERDEDKLEDKRYDSIKQLEDECRKKKQEIEELKEAYKATNKKNIQLQKDKKMGEYRLQMSLNRRNNIIESIKNYPVEKIRLFTNLTSDEKVLFDYILDIMSEVCENGSGKNRFNAAKKDFWEEYSVDERIKLLQLIEKAVDSDGDLWMPESYWNEVCYKIMYPVQHRIKQNLENLYELVSDQKMNSYQDDGWLQELDRKIEKIRKKYIVNTIVEEDDFNQIEKYMNEK